MRVKPGFVLKEIAGEYYAIPFDESYEKQGAMISLNHSAAFLWQQLEEETDERTLCDAVEKMYQITPALAEDAVREFLAFMRDAQLLVETA
ncbi:MAG: PqqD family protein [Clostridia bacterium]|nr:PqqD family protein [Clostridia bacterium]